MRRIYFLLFLVLPGTGFAQFGWNIAVKAGINFANVTNASEVNADNRTGYMFGLYTTPKNKKTLGFRSEIMLSRQGYDYSTGTNTGTVDLDYLLLPQLITLQFTRFVQLHVGGQIAFLLNAKVDSTGGSGNGSLLDYFKRFDYGFVAGGEVFPFKGLFAGTRVNISLDNITIKSNRPNFIPDIDAKNNVVQVYVGIRL